MTHLDEIKANAASDELIAQLAEMVQERLAHEHPRPGQGEDFFCLNHTAYMGERMGNVLARLREAEAALAKAKADGQLEAARYFARRMHECERSEKDGGHDARWAAYVFARTVAETYKVDLLRAAQEQPA